MVEVVRTEVAKKTSLFKQAIDNIFKSKKQKEQENQINRNKPVFWSTNHNADSDINFLANVVNILAQSKTGEELLRHIHHNKITLGINVRVDAVGQYNPSKNLIVVNPKKMLSELRYAGMIDENKDVLQQTAEALAANLAHECRHVQQVASMDKDKNLSKTDHLDRSIISNLAERHLTEGDACSVAGIVAKELKQQGFEMPLAYLTRKTPEIIKAQESVFAENGSLDSALKKGCIAWSDNKNIGYAYAKFEAKQINMADAFNKLDSSSFKKDVLVEDIAKACCLSLDNPEKSYFGDINSPHDTQEMSTFVENKIVPMAEVTVENLKQHYGKLEKAGIEAPSYIKRIYQQFDDVKSKGYNSSKSQLPHNIKKLGLTR